jgi:hypothetical protein
VNTLPGDLGEVVPPVPIPNTVVKRFSADDTERKTFCGKYAIARKLVFLSHFSLLAAVMERRKLREEKWQADLRNFLKEPVGCSH